MTVFNPNPEVNMAHGNTEEPMTIDQRESTAEEEKLSELVDSVVFLYDS